MNGFVIRAASFMDRASYGNDRLGLRPWPPALAQAFEQGDVDALRWNTLFTSETSRFGRMDLLSRLGLMAVELLETEFASMEPAQRDAMGLCIETRSGSTVTDLRFLEMPLASTFAYTLPSTVIGEICIRHRFRGPIMCLLPPRGQGGSLETAFGWLNRGEADAALCVACDLSDKRIAAPRFSSHDSTARDWLGCAVLIGRTTGAKREHPWHLDSLPLLARSLCTLDPNAPNPAA